MNTCPNCVTSNYSTFANGSTRVGYCQHCSYESREPTTDNDTEMVVLTGPSRIPAPTKDTKPKKRAKQW